MAPISQLCESTKRIGDDDLSSSSSKSNLEKERLHLSLQVLQRQDKDILEVVAQSSFVSVYDFDEAKKWSRGDVEGFLHIVRRISAPYYRLIVVNQRHPKNFVVDITDDWDISSETNFLFFRIPLATSSSKSLNSGVKWDQYHRVSCLWFFDTRERELIENSLENLILMLKNASREKKGSCGINAGRSILNLISGSNTSNDEYRSDLEVNGSKCLKFVRENFLKNDASCENQCPKSMSHSTCFLKNGTSTDNPYVSTNIDNNANINNSHNLNEDPISLLMRLQDQLTHRLKEHRSMNNTLVDKNLDKDKFENSTSKVDSLMSCENKKNKFREAVADVLSSREVIELICEKLCEKLL